MHYYRVSLPIMFFWTWKQIKHPNISNLLGYRHENGAKSTVCSGWTFFVQWLLKHGGYVFKTWTRWGNVVGANVVGELYVQTLFWRYLWKSNFSACQILRLTISYMPRINHNYSNLQPNDNNALVWLDICTCGRAFRRVPWTDASSRPLNTQTMPILQQTVWDEAIKICIQLDESLSI